MGGTRFRLDLTLRNLSLISIATKLWDSEDIRNHIKHKIYGPIRGDENWCEISKLVVQNANSMDLPPSLSVLLRKTILFIGHKIYDWILHVTQYLGLDFIFTKRIYFSFGAVDEMKIFDLYWRDLMVSHNFKYEGVYFKHSPLFSLACLYGHERFLKERKNEMLDELSKFYPEIKTGDEIYNIMSVSICINTGANLLVKAPPPEFMFRLCLRAGLSEGAKFYWEKLDEVEKVSNLTRFAKECLRKDYITIFAMEKCCENLLFLINQMGEEERYLFLTDYADEIIKVFLPVWPYQELIVDILKYDWNIESSRLQKMAQYLISFSLKWNRLELNNELLFQIMEKAWGNIPVDEKLHFFSMFRCDVSRLLLTLTPEIFHLFFITKVDGTEMVYSIKEGFVEFVRMGKFDFLNTITETFFNFIPEPKERMKENFSNYDFVVKLIKKDESFDLLDQFLYWLAESEVERDRLKNKINTISVYRSLMKPPYELFKFELAEKFLKWRLQTDAKIKLFKKEMKSYNFAILKSSGYVRIKSGDLSWLKPGDLLPILWYPFDYADGFTFLSIEDATELNRDVKWFFFNDLGPEYSDYELGVDYVGTKVGDFIVFTLCEIWGYYDRCRRYMDKFLILSNAFIKSYYKTDKKILKFKKTKLHAMVTANLSGFIFLGFYSHGLVPEDFLDDFCKFCMISSKKIEEFKSQQRSDIEKVLDAFLIDEREFDFADIYLNWLFGKDKKTEVAKKYLNSSNRGALLCVSYLKECGGARPVGLSDWKICKWLSMVEDMEKVKNDLFALYGNTPEWFSVLLHKAADIGVNTSFNDTQYADVVRHTIITDHFSVFNRKKNPFFSLCNRKKRQ